MGKQSGLHCCVITPERQVLDADVSEVVFPARDGLIGILHDRAPLLCELGIGVLRMSGGSGGGERYFVDGGFAQVLDNEVTILTSRALPATEISSKAATDALIAAQQMKITDDASAEAHDRAMARARTLQQLAH